MPRAIEICAYDTHAERFVILEPNASMIELQWKSTQLNTGFA